MGNIEPRQIWVNATPTDNPRCTAFDLPSPGLLVLNATTTITLDQNAIYQPFCTPVETGVPNATLPILDLGDPFEASTVPQIFVLGCMMISAWSLLIILMINPRRSFTVGGYGGLNGGGRGSSGATTVIAIGGRPWLQKFAAATVAISLVIAAVNSFKIIQEQYYEGFEDAEAVNLQVVASTEIRIIRVISTTSLWLAQVQTLIRLFPRHREKVIIKWAGFGLIVLNTLFTILNNFVANNSDGPSTVRPRRFTEAIPALAYLFELALGLLYAAWVFYYALVKRRFAFFHPNMRNICLVALLSIVSVSIPVVFFVMDIAKPNLAGWGDYIRWAGAAAASVVVWEWVERIEALEREERKDGILGREIFDEDDMLRPTSSVEISWPRSRLVYKYPFGRSKDWGEGASRKEGGITPTSARPSGSEENNTTASRRPKRRRKIRGGGDFEMATTLGRPIREQDQAPPPQPTASPVSRSDATSANSTVYAVVHHPASPSSAPTQQGPVQPFTPATQLAADANPRSRVLFRNPISNYMNTSEAPANSSQSLAARLQSVPNPFKRRRYSPPPEVSRSAVDSEGAPSAARRAKTRSPKNLFRLKRQQQVLLSDLPVVVVPAQPRGRIWSPPIEGADDDHEGRHPAISADPAASPGSNGNTTQMTNDGNSGDKENGLREENSAQVTSDPTNVAASATNVLDASSSPSSSPDTTDSGPSRSLEQRTSRVSPLPTVEENSAQEPQRSVDSPREGVVDPRSQPGPPPPDE